MNAHESDRYIRRHPLFRDIKRESLRQIASHMSLIEERKGNILYFQGDHARSVYLIRSGLIKLSRITPEGRELTFCIFKENDLFGVASLFLGSPRDTAAGAVTDTVLYLDLPERFYPDLQLLSVAGDEGVIHNMR